MITAYGGQASTKNPILVVDESRLSAVIRQPVPPAVSFQGLTRDRLEKRPVGSLAPSKPPTGPAPPRRSVCAPAAMSPQSIADHLLQGASVMTFLLSTWLQAMKRTAAMGARTDRGAKRIRRNRITPRLEALEDRAVPSTLTV